MLISSWRWFQFIHFVLQAQNFHLWLPDQTCKGDHQLKEEPQNRINFVDSCFRSNKQPEGKVARWLTDLAGRSYPSGRAGTIITSDIRFSASTTVVTEPTDAPIIRHFTVFTGESLRTCAKIRIQSRIFASATIPARLKEAARIHIYRCRHNNYCNNF